jgi:broad specificity phosphatase PhoE
MNPAFCPTRAGLGEKRARLFSASALALIFLILSSPPAEAQSKEFRLPPEAAEKAGMHIVLVRHAYALCSDLQCSLTPEGFAQAGELALLLQNLSGLEVGDIRGFYASSACRTVLTVTPAADAARRPVIAYPANEDAALCDYRGKAPGETFPDDSARPTMGISFEPAQFESREALQEQLSEAAGQAKSGDKAPIYLIADHSNYICAWLEALGVPETDFAHDCSAEGLEHTDFADIYWAYALVEENGQVQWRMHHLENAFDRGIPNPYEQDQSVPAQ